MSCFWSGVASTYCSGQTNHMIRTLLHENSDTLRIIPIWDKPKLAFYDIIFYWSSRLKGRTGQEKVISYIYIYIIICIYIYTYVYVNAGKSHVIILCNVCIYIYISTYFYCISKQKKHTWFWLGTLWHHGIFFMAPSDSISCAISGGNGRTSGNLRSGIIWRRPGKNQAGGWRGATFGTKPLQRFA